MVQLCCLCESWYFFIRTYQFNTCRRIITFQMCVKQNENHVVFFFFYVICVSVNFPCVTVPVPLCDDCTWEQLLCQPSQMCDVVQVKILKSFCPTALQPQYHLPASRFTHLRTNLDVNLLKMPVAPCVLRAWLLPCDSDGDAGPPG